MKKKISSILSFFVLVMNGCLYADPQISCPSDGIILELRLSYFYPASSEFREIFHDGGVNYQLTSTLPICSGQNFWLDGIHLWTAVDYFSKAGNSMGLGDKTHIRIVPLTLGLKYFFPCLEQTPGNFYAAGGMKYYFVHTHNSLDSVQKVVDRNGMGGVIEAGFITPIVDHLLLDLFVAYSFKSFGAPAISNPSVEATGMKVGGTNIGAGVGYQF